MILKETINDTCTDNLQSWHVTTSSKAEDYGENDGYSYNYKTFVFYTKLIFLIIGVIGNMFCIRIWMKKEFLTMSRSCPCITLAGVDTIYVILAFLNIALNYLNETRLFSINAMTCHFSAFIFGYVLQMQSFMVVILTIERAVSVIRPFWIKPYFTRKTMTISVIIISILLLLLNVYHGYFNAYYGRGPAGELGCAYPDNIITDIRQLLWGPIPLLILLPSNMLIIIRLLYRQKKRGSDQNPETVKKSNNITVMILSVTASFTFLALPSSIHILCCRHLPTFYKILDHLNILSALNASLNFYLYLASSKTFRVAAKHHFVSISNKFSHFLLSSNATVTPLDTSPRNQTGSVENP